MFLGVMYHDTRCIEHYCVWGYVAVYRPCQPNGSHRYILGCLHDASENGIQSTFFHCSKAQFQHLHGPCRSFQRWTGVSMGTLAGLQLHRPVRNRAQCPMSETGTWICDSDSRCTWVTLKLISNSICNTLLFDTSRRTNQFYIFE